MSPELDALIRNAIVAAPLGRLLALEPVANETDRVQVRLPFRPEITTFGDLVHGGAIAALIDATATATAWSGADVTRGPRGTTVGLTINYLNGASGRDLLATGRILQRGQSIVVCEVTVADAAATDIARALVTYKLTHRT
ncbi:MAG TPA: PaaI family thioesterase [Candidatus Eisenbacteria bacterium]|nr:PaaI family thioesterase [Candidatus Eisenbacteria bacterium]